MPYQPLGLAGLIIGAIRSAVADPALQEQVDAQAQQITNVRNAFDDLNGRVGALADAAAANGQLDADQAEELAGIKGELEALATALTGPADDPTDNGVLTEVEPVDSTVTSPAADAIAEEQAPAEAGEEQEQQQEQQGE